MKYSELEGMHTMYPGEIPCDANDVCSIVNILYNTLMYIEDPTRDKKSTEVIDSHKIKIPGKESSKQEFIYLKPPIGYDPGNNVSDKKHGSSLQNRIHVRGHWRNQPYGEKHTLRKRKWIMPFWKGPEMSEVVSKIYKVQ